MSTSIYPEDPSSSRMAEFESLLDATMNPFEGSFEELKEEIDLAERYGLCSEEVAEVARQDLEELAEQMVCLIWRKFLIHLRFRAAGKASD